jgi:translation initiation factor IF-2
MQKEKNQNLTRLPDGQVTRPPVVVVLGHIDHGKTSLLSNIRKLEFTAGKPGGYITQHIGAFEIALPAGRREKEGKKITFIDTPGHEAFSQMRSRGAKVADIAILVVAADEGVKAQTKEAIFHIKKTGIPIIVALNKIDKPEADPEKVKRELKAEGILVEDFGGKVPVVKTSAKTGQGIEELLELILLVAEMENLKADISKPAEGVIIESYLDPKRGPTATLILNEGVLNLGEICATPSTLGKAKILEDFQQKRIEKAFPSQPVILIGFEKVPKVGETLKSFPDLKTAKAYLEVESLRQAQSREKRISEVLEIKPEQRVLNLILKTDVLGSIEAIEEVLKKIPQERVVLRILKSEVGEVNEGDIELAKSGRALILGFRVKINPTAENLAQREKIKIMKFEVIYDLVEEVRKFMEKISKPEVVRIDLGKMKVLVDFWKEKNRQIVGGRVIEGMVEKGALIEISREEEIKGRGKMINLQRNKKDIEKALKGEEVGILYEGEEKIQVGDTLIFYKEEREKKI